RAFATLWSALLCATTAAGSGCGTAKENRGGSNSNATLHVGTAQLSPDSPIAGLRQLSPLLALESLARAGDDGRMQPWLAESWQSPDGGRTVVVKLKPKVKFQDGDPLDGPTATHLLPELLRSSLGSLAGELISVSSPEPTAVALEFRQGSPFLL